MGAGADVHAEVEAVQQGAVELVGVDVDGPRPAALRDVLRVRRVPLDDVLVGAVAVDVADRDVVGRVRVARAPVRDDGRRRDAVGRLLQRQVGVALRPRRDRGGCLELDAVHHGRDRVLRGRGARGIRVVGAVGDDREPLAVAVDGEVGTGEAGVGGAGRLGGEQAPAEEHALAGRDRDEASVERLELRHARRHGVGRCCGRGLRDAGDQAAGSGHRQCRAERMDTEIHRRILLWAVSPVGGIALSVRIRKYPSNRGRVKPHSDG